MCAKTFAFFFLSSAMALPGTCQVYSKGIEYKYDISKIASAKEIVWYGLDFSHAGIVEPERISERKEIKEVKYAEFIALFDKKFPASWFYRRLRPKKIISDKNAIQCEYRNMDENSVVIPTNYNFPVDSVLTFIKRYTLPQTSGIGLVLNIETLHKKQRYVLGYFTFFDIATREILYAVRMKGKPGKPGNPSDFVDWWETGVSDLFGPYMEYYLKPILNENNQH